MCYLALIRPLVFLDLETTGINPAVDHIIELGLVKVHPDDRRESLVLRVNPGTPIPPESIRFHGIADAEVAAAPPFAAVALQILAFIGDADLAGFNILRFDLPLLQRELARVGLRLDMRGRAVIDAQVIYHRHAPRDLSAAYRFYCGQDLSDAHKAHADAEACIEILGAQLAVHPDLPRTPAALGDYVKPSETEMIDPDAAREITG